MVSFPQSSWVFSLNPINGFSNSSLLPLANPIARSFKAFKLSASFKEFSEAESPTNKPLDDDEEPLISDPVKLAFSKAKAYRKSKTLNPILTPDPVSEPIEIDKENDDAGEVPAYSKSKSLRLISTPDSVSESIDIEKKDDGAGEVSISIKLAMEKAREYRKNKGLVGNDENVALKQKDTGLEEMNVRNVKDGVVEKNVGKKETISSIDFLGFDFSDKKKSRGVPAGLIPVSDPFPEGDLPEVEFIAGDTSRFGTETMSKPNLTAEDDDGSDLYKPKVSTWGVFPRPSNISKTFGGGRVIRPGEVLETSEDKAAKEAHTRELLTAYRKKMGLNINLKMKAECEKALKDGDDLMDLGKLQEALPYYEKVMKELVFQSELHGLAALQWSICQDSLSRSNEARVMYERLQSHPNVQVSKKARQFMFGFQAMEMMKITKTSGSPQPTGYQKYFEAFVKDQANSTLPEEENQDALREALPYILFLFSPIFLVLFIAVKKGI